MERYNNKYSFQQKNICNKCKNGLSLSGHILLKYLHSQKRVFYFLRFYKTGIGNGIWERDLGRSPKRVWGGAPVGVWGGAPSYRVSQN